MIAIRQMVAIKYKAMDTEHLKLNERELLNQVLKVRIRLFQGIIGCWKGEKVNLELILNAKPFCRRSYNIPRAYHKLLREELQQLCKKESGQRLQKNPNE